MVEPEGPKMAIWRRVACWISKATRSQAYARPRALTSTQAHARQRAHTQKYAIFIVFPQQKWFRERASVLTLYVHWLSWCKIGAICNV
jgi:hypothetical protein